MSRLIDVDNINSITLEDSCHVLTYEKGSEIDCEIDAPTVNQWIPCSSGNFPDDLQEVNVTLVNHEPASYCAHIKDKPLTATAVYYRGEWHWWTQYTQALLAEYRERCDVEKMDEAIEVIAWMPLPEPYQEP